MDTRAWELWWRGKVFGNCLALDLSLSVNNMPDQSIIGFQESYPYRPCHFIYFQIPFLFYLVIKCMKGKIKKETSLKWFWNRMPLFSFSYMHFQFSFHLYFTGIRSPIFCLPDYLGMEKKFGNQESIIKVSNSYLSISSLFCINIYLSSFIISYRWSDICFIHLFLSNFI